jgi:hypothetical protein
MRIKFLLIIFLIPLILFAGHPYKDHSVLANGKWFRISLQKTGIYKITYDDFVAMGFDPATLDPAKIAVYGNGGGMLPELNSAPRVDDLQENAIVVKDGGDGKLDQGDYVLFYGEAPDIWYMNNLNRKFYHTKNLYSDSTFYYVTVGSTNGKRVHLADSIPDTTHVDNHSVHFTGFAFHDIDSVNLAQSGKTWIGPVMQSTKNTTSFTFTFPNVDSIFPARVITHVLANSIASSSFLLTDHRNFNQQIKLEIFQPTSYETATDSTKVSNMVYPHSPMNFTLSYAVNEPNATGWLDYVEVTCQQKLIFCSPQMSFRDPNVVYSHNTMFTMGGANDSVIIWNVTNRGDIRQIRTQLSNSTMVFNAFTDTLQEMIAFDGSLYYPVQLSGPVDNQDLHSLQPTSLVIVTHPLFRQQADSLADFHRTQTNLSVTVVDVNQIFTEFACGQRDLTSIRDFMKMLYDRGAPNHSPRYLLLFGDGSYDPKNRITVNDNFIPPYESSEYLSSIMSYVSDDYFGIMGDSVGNDMNGNIDIGIGRLPVSSVQQARDVLNKIKRYSSLNDSTLADWKNTITFVADNPDSNLHLQQADELADTVKKKYPVFNVKKLYNDAYRFISSPSGLRSPDCEDAIDKTVMEGTAVFSYTGHGGEDGWSDTKICTVMDMNTWNNNYRLPVFITATCEFGRFDNPARPTGGELIITKPDGGGIAIFTTTRKSFASSNIQLAASFFSHLKSLNSDANQRMGDLMRIVKNENNNNVYIRNFVLLGDPAQDISFPILQAVTTKINNKAVGSTPDTLTGLSKVTVTGEIRNELGYKMSNYSGIIYPKVFDKPVTYTTIGNTPSSYPQNFTEQNRVLFSGTSTVKNGNFEFSFVLPRGTGIQYGTGKISYYSHDSVIDASGYYSNVILGGENAGADTVVKGPGIALYMNNTHFISGGMTDPNPVMLAFLKDSLGINGFDLGIGHEIVGILDEDYAHAINMTDYYQPDTNSYTSGSIRYPFMGLATGFHSLKLKAWNVFDISTEKVIYFWVSSQDVPVVQQVKNIPNPLRTDTKFVFSSMNITGDVTVQILIYSFTGQLVKTIERNISESAGTVQVINWDGAGDNGRPLSNGIYPYRLMVQGTNGTVAQASQKIIIFR